MYYGELLQTYDPDTERLYAEFDTYFNHPKMRKIKDVNGHSMYMAKSYCLLSNECRYIVAFTKQDRLQAGSDFKVFLNGVPSARRVGIACETRTERIALGFSSDEDLG